MNERNPNKADFAVSECLIWRSGATYWLGFMLIRHPDAGQCTWSGHPSVSDCAKKISRQFFRVGLLEIVKQKCTRCELAVATR